MANINFHLLKKLPDNIVKLEWGSIPFGNIRSMPQEKGLYVICLDFKNRIMILP